MINNDAGNNKVIKKRWEKLLLGHEADTLVHHVMSVKMLEDVHIKWVGEVGCQRCLIQCSLICTVVKFFIQWPNLEC